MSKTDFYISIFQLFLPIIFGFIHSFIEYLFMKKNDFFQLERGSKTGNRTLFLLMKFLQRNDKDFNDKYKKMVLPSLILVICSILFFVYYVISFFMESHL